MTNGHEFWLISRSAGVVALVLVAVSVLIGLTIGYVIRRRTERLVADSGEGDGQRGGEGGEADVA